MIFVMVINLKLYNNFQKWRKPLLESASIYHKLQKLSIILKETKLRVKLKEWNALQRAQTIEIHLSQHAPSL